MAIPTVLQFGTSRFLQAHADLFLAEAMPEARSVVVVQSSGDPARAGRVAALAQGYDVRIRGLQDGKPLDETRRVTSVARGLSLGPDLDEVARLVAGDVEMILSNTADAGFAPQPADQHLDHIARHRKRVELDAEDPLVVRLAPPAELHEVLHGLLRSS